METKTIFTALLEAQKKIEPVTKDATANAGSFKYNYATLGQVIEAVKQELNNAGIFILQPIIDNKVFTSLIYIDGTKIEDGGTPIICAKTNDPQSQGSAISYARRYGLMSLLCLSAEDDDDDGVKAMPSPLKQTTIGDVVREPVNTLVVYCGTCNSVMVEMKGVSKTSGKPYHFYKCPTNGDHPLRNI